MKPALPSAAGGEGAPLSTELLHARATELGCTIAGPGIRVPFFERTFEVSPQGVTALAGASPSERLRDILMAYVSGPPASAARQPRSAEGPVTFRELPGAGPLVVAFVNNTHKTLAHSFGDDLSRLRAACRQLGGRLEAACPGFDLAAEFRPLPKLPLHLRFNASEAAFPAEAALLFDADAPAYLDLHSLFAVATYFTGRLIRGG